MWGSSNPVAAYLYSRSGTTWVKQSRFVASDNVSGDYFGEKVALNNDSVIVSAMQQPANTGAAYIFLLNPPPPSNTGAPSGTLSWAGDPITTRSSRCAQARRVIRPQTSF